MVLNFDVLKPLELFIESIGYEFIIYFCSWFLLGVVPVSIRYLFRKGQFMFDLIVNFLGIADVSLLPEIVVQRIYETGCASYVVLMILIYLMIYSVFRAFFKRA